MKHKNKNKKENSSTNGRLWDFVSNFAAVVLGIIITFAGSNFIEQRKTQKELKDALGLIKNEMLLNREYITHMMEIEVFEKQGASYLLHHKDNLYKASADSLEKYRTFPFQIHTFICIDDAIEMLKTSSLMSAIKDKELATQIIKTYNAIKGSYETFRSFIEIKQKNIDDLIDIQEVKKFMTGDESTTAASEWTFYFKFPEGINLVQQIYLIHDNPIQMYDRFIKQIDETTDAIAKF